jgi:hypothetical protein
VDQHVRDPWLKSMLDLECFVLSGMLAKDTLAAEMVFMFMERGQGRNRIDYPVSGCFLFNWFLFEVEIPLLEYAYG